MHNLPQFLVISSRKKNKKKASLKPKLERLNAKKNIDYEIPSTSSEHCCVRSSELIDAPKSLRIDGSDAGQLEVVYRSLGFDSLEDFGIPVASWEARKSRCNSDFVRIDRENIVSEHEYTIENVENRCDDVVGSGGSRGVNGIRGVRPPVLSPPSSSISKGLTNRDGGCEWDVVRDFASREGSAGSGDRGRVSLSDEEEGGVEDVGKRLERMAISASCSFTTSNDDDSCSSTSVSPNGFGCNVSTNGRFRHLMISHWQRGELLGRGSFGSVYEGICDGGYFIAVKEVSLLDQGEVGRQRVIQLEQEIALLSQFEHDNIVRYYGTDRDESKLYIFLELVTKGSLLSLYQRYRLQDCQVSSYTRQILHGLKYLHERGVVHRDIKCANILVDANGSVKLADFGLAKATKSNDVKSCKGTAFWMAPEVVNLKNKGYGLAADIWSLGCTVLEMLTHRIPYAPMECMAALFKIGNGIRPPVPHNLSREARDFILQCFHINPSDRPTASQLLHHPFVKGHSPCSQTAHPHSPGIRRG